MDEQLTRQFNKDGTSFEGSSHYAAFVTEALILCKYAIEEFSSDIDSNRTLKRIEKIIRANRYFLSKKRFGSKSTFHLKKVIGEA